MNCDEGCLLLKYRGQLCQPHTCYRTHSPAVYWWNLIRAGWKP